MVLWRGLWLGLWDGLGLRLWLGRHGLLVEVVEEMLLLLMDVVEEWVLRLRLRLRWLRLRLWLRWHRLFVEVVYDLLLNWATDGRGRAQRRWVVGLAGDGDERALRHWHDLGWLLSGAWLVVGAMELSDAVGAVEVGVKGDAERTGTVELSGSLALVLAVTVLALDCHLEVCTKEFQIILSITCNQLYLSHDR